jgi:hypothetical protein
MATDALDVLDSAGENCGGCGVTFSITQIAFTVLIALASAF